MPDCHAFCKDIEQSKQEVLKRFKLSDEIQKGIGLGRDDFEFAIRIVKDFWEENEDYIKNLVKEWGKPTLIEIWDKKFFYFIFKHEWNFVDALGKAACLTTDQIDVENGERYGLTFMDSDNKKKHPMILHLSPSGAVERVMYALLEKYYMQQKQGNKPIFPLWLCPTQVRLCPVSENFFEFAEEIAKEMEKHNIRVDIDDRPESISRKIRDSEKEWNPYTIVIGDKEKKSGKISVRKRVTGKTEEMDTKDLVKDIEKQTKGMPFRPLPLPKYMTKRPLFRG
jgi:threonyl-tRNA synthetase